MIRRSKSTVPYRPALLLKDGTLLEHPEALAHFQLFTLNPNLNVATFDMASIDLSGGLDADGYFHSMKWFSDKKSLLATESTASWAIPMAAPAPSV